MGSMRPGFWRARGLAGIALAEVSTAGGALEGFAVDLDPVSGVHAPPITRSIRVGSATDRETWLL